MQVRYSTTARCHNHRTHFNIMLNIIILERNLYYTLGYRYYYYNNIVIYVNSLVYIKHTVRLILFRVGYKMT